MNAWLITSGYETENKARAWELAECRRINAKRFDRMIDMRVPERPSFAQLFEATRGNAAGINVVANADIFFDRSIEYAIRYPATDRWCMALTRWNVTTELQPGDGPWLGADAWIFNGAAPSVLADFPMGAPECDARIAKIIEESGVRVFNPCHTIRAHHLHNSGFRTYGEDTPKITGPYLIVPQSDILGRAYPQPLNPRP